MISLSLSSYHPKEIGLILDLYSLNRQERQKTRYEGYYPCFAGRGVRDCLLCPSHELEA